MYPINARELAGKSLQGRLMLFNIECWMFQTSKILVILDIL